ncbi:MAG: hypothetical protein IJ121_04995 [Eubacterium sp.]|nr:hypothetical protein [Eubacterium sp.]
MKKQLSGVLACMLILSMAVSAVPVSVYATETEPKEYASAVMAEKEENVKKSTAAEAVYEANLPENRTVETVKPAEVVTGASVDIADNAELFAGYVNEQFYGPAAVSGGKLKARRVLQREKLTEPEKLAYDYLHSSITEVASGKLSNTDFFIPLEEHGLEKMYYTAENLGMDTLLDNEGEPIDEAVIKMYELVQFQISDVMDALAADCPYELYWYDKTIGYAHSTCGYGDYSDGTAFVCLPDKYEVAMSVAQAYAPEQYNVEDYTADTTKTGATRAAVEHAEEILATYGSSSDYEKLVGYKDTICDEVSYNGEAAANHNTPYGDPWQLIYVFDGDASTNVVCEGYSKAFQYLCDQSDFNGVVTCNSMSGHMDGGTGAGAHMWNVVSIGGQNYLADITNVDDDSVGARGSKLFLAGTDIESDASGYTFHWDHETEGDITYHGATIIYQYDEDTISQYSEEERIISSVNYNPETYEAEPESAKIQLEDVETKAGEMFELPVTLIANPGLTYLKFAIVYNTSALKLTGYQNAGLDGWTVGLNGEDDAVWSGTEKTFLTGTILNLQFEVLESAPEGDENIVISIVEAYNGDKEEILFEAVGGTVTIGHSLVSAAGYPAGCTTEGRRAYFCCESCGKVFEDAEGEIETSLDALTISPTGHMYGEPEWIWTEDEEAGYTAVAEFTCEKGDDTQTIPAVVTSITKPATGEEEGSVVYTAEAEFAGETWSNGKTVILPPKGHAYAEPDQWIWSEDYSSAQAVFKCIDNDGNEIAVNAVITCTEIAASCVTNGEITYTAKVVMSENVYTDVKKISILAEGQHIWEEPIWSWTPSDEGGYIVEAIFKCTQEDDTQTIGADVTSKIITPATSTSEGVRTYTATVRFGDQEYTDTMEEVIQKISEQAEEAVNTIVDEIQSDSSSIINDVEAVEELSFDDPDKLDTIIKIAEEVEKLDENSIELLTQSGSIEKSFLVNLSTAKSRALQLIKEEKQKLSDEVAVAAELDGNEYTSESYRVLQTAVAEARTIIQDSSASAKELSEAQDKVASAKSALVKTSSDHNEEASGNSGGNNSQTDGNTGGNSSQSGTSTSAGKTGMSAGNNAQSVQTQSVKAGTNYTVAGQTYKVTKAAAGSTAGTVIFIKAKNVKNVVVPDSVKLADGKTYKVVEIAAKAFTAKKIRKVTIGANVVKLAANTFAKSRAKTVILKTQSLKKASVKGSLKKSKITKVQIKVGAKKLNKKYVKKYKKIFTKKNAGKNVSVK